MLVFSNGIVFYYFRRTNSFASGLTAKFYLLFAVEKTCYHPINDALVVAIYGNRGSKDTITWSIYDCAKNEWVGVDISGPNCTGNSMGLMYDSLNENVVAVDTRSNIYILKLDMSKAKALE